MPESPTEQTKRVVTAYYDAMNRKDPDAVLALYTDETRIWVAGQGPYAGWQKTSREGIEGFFAAFDIRFEILDETIAGERAALELASKGTLQGKPYTNEYHNLLVVRDGRIAVLKEYFDTALAGG